MERRGGGANLTYCDLVLPAYRGHFGVLEKMYTPSQNQIAVQPMYHHFSFHFMSELVYLLLG